MTGSQINKTNMHRQQTDMEWSDSGAILLMSCYELGHQPMSLALPLGLLRNKGFSPLANDIAVDQFDYERAQRARFIGISVPMHTALRLGIGIAERIRKTNPDCHICFYGLYAALNASYLLQHGADSCIGGEFEQPMWRLIQSLKEERNDSVDGVIQLGEPETPSLHRQRFPFTDRSGLPDLGSYAHLIYRGERHTTGYTESSRGCRYLCTHCPIPPVYGSRFFVVPSEVVLADIRSQVDRGATHITFGDPDFLNGPGHAVRIVEAMHQEFPDLTFDFTAKVEHILKYENLFPLLGRSGAIFVVTAVESLNEKILAILDKGHTRKDVTKALEICRKSGIAMRPTWVSFTPWTSRQDYLDVLDFVYTNGLVDHIDPVQYSIRLLIPPGSLLVDHPKTVPFRGELDKASLTYRWSHPDPEMDTLQVEIFQLVEENAKKEINNRQTFQDVWERVNGQRMCDFYCEGDERSIPRLTEPWFC